MRALAHPLAEQLTLPALLHALSDPVRLHIVRELRDGVERPCGQLEVAVSKSTLSHHLRVLRDAGLTHTRADGVQRFVSLRRDDVNARFPGLLSCVLEQERGRPQAAARPAREPSAVTQASPLRRSGPSPSGRSPNEFDFGLTARYNSIIVEHKNYRRLI